MSHAKIEPALDVSDDREQLVLVTHVGLPVLVDAGGERGEGVGVRARALLHERLVQHGVADGCGSCLDELLLLARVQGPEVTAGED